MEQEHIVYKNIYTILFICLMYICIFICEHVRSKTKLPWNGKSCFNFFAQKGRAGHCLRLNQEMCAGLCAITALSIRKKV